MVRLLTLKRMRESPVRLLMLRAAGKGQHWTREALGYRLTAATAPATKMAAEIKLVNRILEIRVASCEVVSSCVCDHYC